jgi:hypothetical protein
VCIDVCASSDEVFCVLHDYSLRLQWDSMLSEALWWGTFPVCVIRSYRWLHGGAVKLPSPRAVRVLGCAWLVLIGIVSWIAK